MNFRNIPILGKIFDMLDDGPIMTFLAFMALAFLSAKIPNLDEYRDIFVYSFVGLGAVIAGAEKLSNAVAKGLNTFAKPIAGAYQTGVDAIEAATGFDIPDAIELDNYERFLKWLEGVDGEKLEALFKIAKAKQAAAPSKVELPPMPPPDTLSNQ